MRNKLSLGQDSHFHSLEKIFDKEWWFRKVLGLGCHIFPADYIKQLKQHHIIRNCYQEAFGVKLHLKHPCTLNEKLIWLALYWKHPLKAKCADKVKLRNYVKEKGLPDELMPHLLGCWNDPNEIDFDTLPTQYVLKCNHGCAFNIIVKDCSSINREKLVRQLTQWLSLTYVGSGIEFHYADIYPRLAFCEEYIPITGNGLWQTDYKFMCLNGSPEFILVCYDRDESENAKFASFSLEWEQLFCCVNEQRVDFPKPKSLNKMIEYSHSLSQDFPFVRVDFYEANEKPYLGELTFTPYGNMITYIKPEALLSLGKKLKLPKKYCL